MTMITELAVQATGLKKSYGQSTVLRGVVLPAPFGPSRAKILPWVTREIHPPQHRGLAVRLLQAGGLHGQLGDHRHR